MDRGVYCVIHCYTAASMKRFLIFLPFFPFYHLSFVLFGEEDTGAECRFEGTGKWMGSKSFTSCKRCIE